LSTRVPITLALLVLSLAAGCATTSGLVARLAETPPPAERLRIAGKLGASRSPEAVAPLVRLLADTDYVLPRGGAPGEFGAHVEYVSGRANRSLVRLTGRDFGFSPFERAELRARARRAWEDWHASVEGRLRYDMRARRLVAGPEPEPAPREPEAKEEGP